MARTGRTQHRRRGFRSTARKLMAVCLDGVLLFSNGGAVAGDPVEGLLRRELSPDSSDAQGESGIAGVVATCTVASSGDAVTRPATTLTLSSSTLVATLECMGQSMKALPADAATVCVAEATASKELNSSNCSIGDTSMGNPVKLQELLGTNDPVQWKAISSSDGKNQGESRMLELSEASLPRTDKKFMVGCQSGEAGENKSCQVTVNVNAKPSSVDDKNAVTCAYGKDSNPEAVEVEMSEDKNTLTIDCGKGGSMQPAEFTSQYCSPEGDTFEDCSKANYSDVLPTFASTWWTNTENKTQATLTIPKTDFPPEDQRLLLGCVPKTQNADQSTREENLTESVSETSSCRVLVTVKAASSASAVSFTPQAVAATSGAVLLAGLFSGSL
ncbi:srs domain-containing protein [Neospora caninum Liverpool]|uniref:Srs domain-containing protein n=1 Tax=Neospora caninum (strain Liverpool) TaxID=572307 RepID=F0V8C1_NEOCL|nr:srs domain-containing protein [Neospora caninum Liverpool]CBZ49962.1 srs domain-containing protein [Neospora caninum Liverpool]CEL64550.1 TPA: SRS domain-containing protein [Neospora caninum Liverpool]|eukprot:XP_003879997.1 srs domain-containing protein [Neospora caninum Liverpool]